jgi:hypothetical protein
MLTALIAATWSWSVSYSRTSMKTLIAILFAASVFAQTVTPPSGGGGASCSGDINSGCNTVLGINGGSVPASAKILGTNSGGQPIAATQASVNALGYASGGGTANAQTAALSPAVTALATGLTVCWIPTAANTTTTPTLAVNGLTATTLVKAGGVALAANDLTTTAVACAIYDGTYFELQNPQTSQQSGNLWLVSH